MAVGPGRGGALPHHPFENYWCQNRIHCAFLSDSVPASGMGGSQETREQVPSSPGFGELQFLVRLLLPARLTHAKRTLTARFRVSGVRIACAKRSE